MASTASTIAVLDGVLQYGMGGIHVMKDAHMAVALSGFVAGLTT